MLVMTPVLAYPRFGGGVEFVLETDASTCGLGASRKLQLAEENYPITELETLAIVWAVKYFRSYLLGHRVIVVSACTLLLNFRNPSPKLARWATIIQEMDLTIKHRREKSNTNADSLSRLPSAPSDHLERPLCTVNVNGETQACGSSCEGEVQAYRDACEAVEQTDSKVQVGCADVSGPFAVCTRGSGEGEGRESISCPYHVCSS